MNNITGVRSNKPQIHQPILLNKPLELPRIHVIRKSPAIPFFLEALNTVKVSGHQSGDALPQHYRNLIPKDPPLSIIRASIDPDKSQGTRFILEIII